MSDLPKTNTIPTLLTNAKIYNDGDELFGVGDVEVPTFEYMTETLTGLGIGGETDVPVLGHFKSFTSKIKWNAPTEKTFELLKPKAHHLDVRGNIQEYDAGTGEYANKAFKMIMRGTPSKGSSGKVEAGKKMEGESEFNVSYVKLWIGGNEVMEVDIFNFICKINGEDSLDEVRKNMGM